MQSFPDPSREIFAGRVLEPFDVIEAMMIELVEQGLKGAPQFGEIHHPAGLLTNGTTDVDFDPERMPVHAGTFVPLRDIGQAVGGFDLKYAKYIHGRIVPPMCTLRKHSFPPRTVPAFRLRCNCRVSRS